MSSSCPDDVGAPPAETVDWMYLTRDGHDHQPQPFRKFGLKVAGALLRQS